MLIDGWQYVEENPWTEFTILLGKIYVHFTIIFLDKQVSASLLSYGLEYFSNLIETLSWVP